MYPLWKEIKAKVVLGLLIVVAGYTGSATLTETANSSLPALTGKVYWADTNTNLCLEFEEVIDSSWPVWPVIKDWNDNQRTKFRFNLVQCDAWVYLSEENLDLEYGKTEYNLHNNIRIILSANVPSRHRQHVLCHELGHALGRAHPLDATEQSCMSIHRFDAQPSENDLQVVGSQKWEWLKSRRQAGGH